MANNFPDFTRRTWIWESDSSSIEREKNPNDFLTERVRAVEYVTMYQDCSTVSLQGAAYVAFKRSPILDTFVSAEYKSHVGPSTVSASQLFGTEWTVAAVQAVSNHDGTARVLLTIRRAGEWEDDVNVDVE